MVMKLSVADLSSIIPTRVVPMLSICRAVLKRISGNYVIENEGAVVFLFIKNITTKSYILSLGSNYYTTLQG